ncbi:hypothetical protein CEXT_463631 [Caerostris extrusa]|uniref:PiggyBac transposable element-derived protein domain-containing protein n=1 Tax=Caerostris extrusa TaxID=172846 RepID=A0AAV4Q183_CAEEX|nr:hypothetical protein CEXT_463631 [Caerostris extrusa]
MGGVNTFNHLKSSYSSSRKLKKCCHRLFYFHLDASLVNSYILYVDNHNVAKNSHLEIRLRIARGVIEGFSSKNRKLQSSWVATKRKLAFHRKSEQLMFEYTCQKKGKHTKRANIVAPKLTRNGQKCYIEHVMFHCVQLLVLCFHQNN